jgi:hypothetical protein
MKRKSKLPKTETNIKPYPKDNEDVHTFFDTDAYSNENSLLEIDRNELDAEWAKQPKLYHEYAVQLGEMKRKLDEAEANLKVVKADVDKAIRLRPSKYSLADKPTEASIATTIVIQKRYIKAQNEVVMAQYDVNITDAMVRSLDHKKSALENMVRLHGQDYFSTPKADAVGRERLDEQRSDKVAKMCRKPKKGA